MQSKLEQLFTTPPSEHDRFRSNNSKKITSNFVYSIHSLTTLGELLAEKKQGNEIADLRYLVDVNGEAWFARETHSDAPTAPAHYKMTGSPRNAAYCRTAGNLFFSDDYSTLIKLNNKSGDFRPSLNSIKWILAILVANEDLLPFQLPEILMIEEQGHNGKVIDTHLCPIADLKKWLNTFNTELTLCLKKQNSPTKEAPYQRDGGNFNIDVDQGNMAPSNTNRISRRLGFEHDEPIPRKLAFGETAPSDESSMSIQDELPIRPAKTYTSFRYSPLPLLRPRKMTASIDPQQTLTPLFFRQEASAEELGSDIAPPPPKKRKHRTTQNFVSSIAQPSELEPDEETAPRPVYFG
jgi:hypothetical protein